MFYAQYCRLGVPVSASNRAVIREAHKMLSAEGCHPSFRRTRHNWLRAILAEHAGARMLYKRFNF